jgi:subtilisin family serine protease
MKELASRRPGCVQWLALLVLAGWLALVPLALTVIVQILTGSLPEFLVPLDPGALDQAFLSRWASGLLATVLTLGLHLLVFAPLLSIARRRRAHLVSITARLSIVIAVVQALNALTGLVEGMLIGGDVLSATAAHAFAAAMRLGAVLPLLLLRLGRFEARRQDGSLLASWRRVGLRRWLNPSALWLAVAVGAVIVWPWVVVGSLGSPGTTAANLLQGLPNALNEELLFRGFAFAWLWRVTRSRRGGALGSMVLFVAAQGGTVLPYGDWEALLHFVSALTLGLLTLELTVRAGGSIWPAVVVHLIYGWFRFAFVDPRTVEAAWFWQARVWASLAAGGLGLVLWVGPAVIEVVTASPVARARSRMVRGRRSLGGTLAAMGLALVTWAAVAGLYLTVGVPGFHPDGFLIFLEEQADLSPAAAIADPVERRAFVYQALVETAERSQAPLRAELDRQGVPHRPHYLVNMIEVQARPGLRHTFARRTGVASVLFQPGVRRYAYPSGISDVDISGPQGVEWNVREVGADRVWDLGYTGQGVIVGGADSGVVWDHPALKEAYLGWDGDDVDHNYHWYDPWDERAVPWDDDGHGTHTTGIIVGGDGENQIGLAPGARWIACRNMRQGLGNPGSYISCMEFLLAPFPLGGDPLHDGDPARGAQVVNNSWGCPHSEGCGFDTMRLAVEHLRTAGQMMVVSAGNEGPDCSTVDHPPSSFDSVLSVGATEQDDEVASFSSRGPVTIDGSQQVKPDLVAPGVDIRSSVPGGYTSLQGTSMAGPHVAGAVALLWSADPALIGDLERTKAILTETAQPLTVDAICTGDAEDPGTVCGCGTDGPESVPNNVYGWGQVDTWAAVQQVVGEP